MTVSQERSIDGLNVYDFDNTIYRGESGVSIFFFFLKKDLMLLKKIPWGIELIIKYKTGRMTMEQVLDKYSGFLVSYGQSIANFDDKMEEFWDIHGKRIKPFYLKQRKDDDLIISACPDIILEVICKRLNIRNYITTKTEKDTMRMISFCYRENKVKAFKEIYADTVIDNFYTDSYNDSAMFDLARNVYIVKGNRMKKIK